LSKLIDGNTQTEPTDRLADVGKQLRRAREASNLSIQSVAASLHLAPKVVIALEENDLGQFQPVFVKGYLRNYGHLLNLPVEPLIESYNRTIQPDQDTFQPPKQGSKASNSPLFFYLLLTAGILSLVVWATGKVLFPLKDIPASQSAAETSPLSMSPAQPAGGDGSEPPLMQSENLSSAGVANGQSSQSSDKAEPDKPISTVATDANELVGPPKPGSSKTQDGTLASANPMPARQPESLGPDTIAVHLSAKAWVGIRDHAGHRLVYEKIPAGTDRSFSGQAPFLVVLGNSPATKIEFNGKPFTPPKSKAGTVAKFTLGQTSSQEAGASTVKKRP